jgi:DNA-damage-inducible protein J
MSNTAIYIKTETQTKKEAQKVARELGLSLSAIVNGFLKRFIKTKTVTFSANEEIPNERTLAIMKQAEKNYKEGNTSPLFDNAKVMEKWFDEQGI